MSLSTSEITLDQLEARLRDIYLSGKPQSGRVSLSAEQAKGLVLEIEGLRSKVSRLENIVDAVIQEYKGVRALIKSKFGIDC